MLPEIHALTLRPLAVRQPLRLRHDFWPKSCSVTCTYRLQSPSTPAALQLACPAGKVEWAVHLELSVVRWAAYTCLMMF